MGLKFGFVQLLSENGLYFPISTRKGSAYSFAKAMLFDKENQRPSAALRFLNGSLGYLARNRNYQLEVVSLDKNVMWVPTREQSDVMSGASAMPKDFQIFGGSHVVSEVFPQNIMNAIERRKSVAVECSVNIIDRRVSDTIDSVPPVEHKTVQERFKSPDGPWNEAVAYYLRRGNALAQ